MKKHNEPLNMQSDLTVRIIVVSALAILCTLPERGLAVPPNPHRPLDPETCNAAQLRLAEAREGSPLLSSDEQANVLRVALAYVARLCTTDHPEDANPEQALPVPSGG